MKKIILSLIVATVYLISYASVIDSLTSELTKPETDKGVIYSQLSEEYLNISPEKSINYAVLAIQNAQEETDIIDYRIKLGIAYEYSGQYKKALLEYESALNYAKEISYNKGQGVSLINISIAKTQVADYANALEYALKAIKIFETLDERKYLTSAFNNLGNIYLQLENNTKALHYYEIVLKYRQESNDEAGLAKILHNISLVYMSLKNSEKAIEYLEQAKEGMQNINDKYGLAFCYNNLSNAYQLQDNYLKSIDYNLKALELFKEIENPEGIAYTNYLVGFTYLTLEEYEQASDYLHKSLELAEEMTLTNLISDNYEALSVYFATIGGYKQAYSYLKLHKAINDSIYSEKNSKRIAKLQSEYEFENQQAKIKSLQENRKYQQKLTTMLILGLIFGTIVLAFLFFLYREKINEISIRQETEKKLIDSEHKFRQLTENIATAVYTFDVEGRFKYVNPATCNITGYSQAELLQKRFFELVHPEDKEKVMSRGFNRIKGEDVVNQYEFKILTKQGKTKWLEISNTRTTIDGLVVVLGTGNDITDRRIADHRIIESERKYKYLVESIEEGLIIADESENFIFTNEAARSIIGYSEDEVENMNFKSLVSANDFKRLQLETDNRIKGKHAKYELEIIRKDGEKRLISVSASPLFDNDDYEGSVGIFVDITEIRKAEEKIKSQLCEKEVMLQEIYHRVKNNLQIISSMLKLQASYVDDEYTDQLFRNCQHRVRSMSLVHEKLYRSDNLSQISFKDYTESLIKNLFASMNISGARIGYAVDIKDIYLNISTAIPCGLIINELITNALKYGFPEERHGLIKVSMHKLDNGKLELKVWNNGIDLPNDFSMTDLSTFGMRLVEILKLQLEAEMHIKRDEGVAFSLIFAIND